MMRSRAVMSSEDSLDRSVLSRRFQLALLLMAAQATLTGVPFKATRHRDGCKLPFPREKSSFLLKGRTV